MNRFFLRFGRVAAAATAAGIGAPLYSVQCSAHRAHDEWTPVDFSKYNLDHHLVHAALTGHGKVENYRFFLAPDRKSIKAELRLGHRGE